MTLTPAEEFLLSFKEHFFWTIVTSTNGVQLAPRACFLQHKPDFGFYICAKNFTQKFVQLKNNPYVTLSINKEKDNNIPVFHATVVVSQEKTDKAAAWFEQMTNFGYTSKDDERLVVFKFTIHSATLGATKYVGVPYDYSKIRVVGDAPLPPLSSGPFQNAEGLAVLQNAWKSNPRGFHLFTFDGLEIHDRMMQLNYSENVGYYIVTGKGSDKVAQLTGNPNVALLQEQQKDNVQVVVDGTLHHVCCPELLKHTWNDGFKQFGFTGVDDPNYVAYFLSIRKIVVHSFTPESPKTYLFEPTAYDSALQGLYKASTSHLYFTLATVDAHNAPHARTMGFTFHSVLGPIMVGRNTFEKYKQLAVNNNVACAAFNAATFEDYSFTAKARVVDSDAIRHAFWSDRMKVAGYTGPEDRSAWAILLNPLVVKETKNFFPVRVSDVYSSAGTGAIAKKKQEEVGNRK